MGLSVYCWESYPLFPAAHLQLLGPNSNVAYKIGSEA
jgi:hypothetical protein